MVVDPDMRRVTHIVVHKGWSLTEDRLIPLDRLDHTELNAIFLKAVSPTLEQYPRFRKDAFVKPAANWQALRSFALKDTLFWLTSNIFAAPAPLLDGEILLADGSAVDETKTRTDALSVDRPEPKINADLNVLLQERLALWAVQVRVVNSMVVLLGNVSTQADSDMAEAIASKVEGVIGIENFLTTDTNLYSRVITGLDDDLLTSPLTIKVIVDRGVVTLKGNVSNKQIRAVAEAITLKIPGVMMIINQLKV